MRTDDLDFELPEELIAQTPVPDRAASRLLHYRRKDESISHRQFSELPAILKRGDLLVFNDTRVLPARFAMRKAGGGLVEALFIEEESPGRWRVMLKNVGAGIGRKLAFDREAELTADIAEQHEGGQYVIVVSSVEPALEVLSRLGRMPLPPYIKRDKVMDQRDAADMLRYQTVYAKAPGAVAAPTAGLHFTPELLHELDRAGVEHTFVTLHVGLGTFKPVVADELAGHTMHEEDYEISEQAAHILNRAKRDERRIIAVGTTSARVLESQTTDEPFEAHRGSTSIFIYPPYRWKHVDALITNFHLPRSTLIALVAALMGLDEQRRVYEEAIAERYRFFSYGDAMFVE